MQRFLDFSSSSKRPKAKRTIRRFEVLGFLADNVVDNEDAVAYEQVPPPSQLQELFSGSEPEGESNLQPATASSGQDATTPRSKKRSTDPDRNADKTSLRFQFRKRGNESTPRSRESSPNIISVSDGNSSSEDLPLKSVALNRKRSKSTTEDYPFEINADELSMSSDGGQRSNPLRHMKKRLMGRDDTAESSADEFTSDSQSYNGNRRFAKRLKMENSRDSPAAASQVPLFSRKFAEANDQALFLKRHITYCQSCSESSTATKGRYIYCQGCSYTYHENCAKNVKSNRIIQVTADLWIFQCRFCIEKQGKLNDPGTHFCCECGEGGLDWSKIRPYEFNPALEGQHSEVINGPWSNANNVMFRCLACHRATHYHHLEYDKNGNGAIIAQMKFICPLCAKYPKKISTVICWRPSSPERLINKNPPDLSLVPGYQREYFVKFEGDSYFHTYWLPGSWVLSVAAYSQLASFHRKHAIAALNGNVSLPEDYFVVDIVLDVRYEGNLTAQKMSFTSKQDAFTAVDKVESVYVKYKGLSYTERMSCLCPFL